MARRHLDWMAQAESDFQVAKRLHSSEDYKWCCFVCQQSAGKAVKALIESKNGKAKVHSISKMLKALGVDDHQILIAARRLEHHYTQPRYPNGFEEGYPRQYYGIEEAEQALSDVELIIQYCRKNLQD
jgi:HEPN domain-containing protein